MTMVSLKRTKGEREELGKGSPPEMVEEEMYPWGARMHFDSEELEKLPKLAKARAGDEMKMTATVRVKEVRASDTDGDSTPNQHVELQVQAVEFMSNGPKPGSDEALEDILRPRE